MITTNIKISLSELKKWFRKEGFKPASFENGKDYITSYWMGQTVSVKLIMQDGFETYYKPAHGGAFMVFDVSVQDEKLVYDCYCPIWLFGIWNKKVSFKKDAGGIFKYRSEGYYVHERFKQFLETAS